MTDKLQKILDEINYGTRKSIRGIDFTQEELFTKDSAGITFLEHLLIKKIPLYSIEDLYKNNVEAAYLYTKYNEALYGFDLSEDDLFEYVNGKRFIDYLVENESMFAWALKRIKNHTEVIDLITHVDDRWFSIIAKLTPELTEKTLIKNEKDEYLLEKYWDNLVVMSLVIGSLKKPDEIIELCEKHNNFEIMKESNIELLMTNYKDTNVLDFLIKEKKIIPKKIEFIPDDISFIKFLMEHDYYEYLEKANENIQLLKIENNKSLLDILIEKGYTPKMNNIKNDETLNKLLDNNIEPDVNYNNKDNILKILYERNRPDLLTKCDLNAILKSDIYFDYILDSIKEGKKIKIPRISGLLSNSDINLRIKYYISIAKKDMVDYINEITDTDLLKKYNDKTLLEYLLEADYDLTTKELLTNKAKENDNVALILKSKGYKQEDVKIAKETDPYKENYVKKEEDLYGIGPLLSEGELLLKQLYDLFINDGKSDKDLIDALISGYREALIKSYDTTIKELKLLLKVKENNIDRFYYIKDDVHPYFSGFFGGIFCDLPVVPTLLHETGHALHYYLTDDKIPDNYKEIIDKARDNPELLKRTEEFVNKVKNIRDVVEKQVDIKCEEYFKDYYTKEKIDEIKDSLENSKESRKKEYLSLGIPEEVINTFIDEKFTLEEYIANQKRIYKKEMTFAILDSKYGHLSAICDVLDAIYEGKLYCGRLENKDGKTIESAPGHGLCYYYGTEQGFKEMVAQFSMLSKSPDSKENLELLRSIVGDEVYNMISDFYYQNIVYSNKFDETKKEGVRL